MPTASDIVGARVRDLRKRCRWNMDELAERCARAGRPELTANALYFLESGRRKDGDRTRNITVDELLVLADVFGLKVDDLLPGSPDDCRRCHGTPPFGYMCNTCGAIATFDLVLAEHSVEAVAT